MSSSAPIVVLDSGLGGLTVVRAMRRVMPREDILYFGDTARVPYGSKSAGTVTQFVREIINYLARFEPKHVVIACNTATALAMPTIRAEFPHLSVSGVIEPGARAAVEAAGNAQRPVIGIMATEATVRSKAYERAVARRRMLSRLYSVAAPLLVPIIEEGRPATDAVVQLALQGYLAPLIEKHVGVLVLGCTHYPVYRELIGAIVGPEVAVIDSADKCAEDVARRLRTNHLERGERGGEEGSLRCFVTDDSPRFASLAERFLGIRVDEPVWVAPEELQGAPAVEVTLGTLALRSAV
jgi:glutamate racemase